MGKSKRKIKRLRRKFMKQKVKPRIPVAPPGFAFKTDKDYDRKKSKLETKRLTDDE